jgi:hypothetical protein
MSSESKRAVAQSICLIGCVVSFGEERGAYQEKMEFTEA